MSYQIEDVDGNQMPGPSISGLSAMRDLLNAQNEKDYPVASHLLEYGHTTKLIALAVECGSLAAKTKNKDVQHSLQELAKYARDFNRTVGNMLILTH